MARRKSSTSSPQLVEPDKMIERLDGNEASLLDVIDSVLDKGAVLDGDLILGVANVDLIYARLSVLLAAIDRIIEPARPTRPPGKRTQDVRSARKRR